MKVRTSLSALVTSLVLAGALGVIAVGDGSPPTSNPKPLISISPMRADPSLPTFHRAGEPQVQPAPAAAEPAKAPSMNEDLLALVFLQGGCTYVIVFLLMHLGLRQASVINRWAYAGLGAAAAAIAIATLTPPAGWRHLLSEGRLAGYLGLVAAFGAIIGFLYVWRAGLDAEDDDVSALESMHAVQLRMVLDGQPLPTPAAPTPAPAAAPAPAHVYSAAAAPAPATEPAVIQTETAEYFDGPLVVRTSPPVMFVAALVSGGLYAMGLFALGLASGMAQRFNPSSQLLAALSGGAEMKAMLMLGTGLVLAVPATLLILLTHLVLRSQGRASYAAYGLGGLAVPVVLGLIAGPIGVILGVQNALPMAIAMCVYRSMAGLEPKPVKEDIRVKDRRNLVGADHVRRRYGRVVNG
jgi:hypothetical protein